METNKDLLLNIIQKAEVGKHVQFQLLRSWSEYRKVQKLFHAEHLLVTSLRKSARKQFMAYCKSVATGTAEPINLLAYKTILKALRFYEIEEQTLKGMLNEYSWYLYDGNWTDFILGIQRSEDKLWDHRG